MKKRLIILLLLCGVLIPAWGQKYRLCGSFGITEKNTEYVRGSLTAGYYVSPRYRLDVSLSYGHSNKQDVNYSNLYSVAFLFTPVTLNSKFIFDPSIGVGYLRLNGQGKNRNYCSIPLKTFCGYHITKALSAGIEVEPIIYGKWKCLAYSGVSIAVKL